MQGYYIKRAYKEKYKAVIISEILRNQSAKIKHLVILDISAVKNKDYKTIA